MEKAPHITVQQLYALLCEGSSDSKWWRTQKLGVAVNLKKSEWNEDRFIEGLKLVKHLTGRVCTQASVFLNTQNESLREYVLL